LGSDFHAVVIQFYAGECMVRQVQIGS